MIRICIRMLRIPSQMDRICIWMLRIPFEWLEFALELFEFLSIGYNLHWNALNLVCRVWIWIPMLQISFEMLELAFEHFETFSNGSNLHLNALNPIRMNLICIWMLRIAFRMDRICIRMLRIPFEWLEFALEFFQFLQFPFECFESHLKGSNLDSNASNPFRMVLICNRMLQIPFEWVEFAFECFDLVWRVLIWIQMLRIPSKC